MKKLLFLATTILFICSCCKPTQQPVQTTKSSIDSTVAKLDSFVITYQDDNDGRANYRVTFPDGTALDNMYPEEIAYSLIKGKWQYNEDLRVVDVSTISDYSTPHSN